MNATASTMTEAQHDALGQLLEAYDWHENDSIVWHPETRREEHVVATLARRHAIRLASGRVVQVLAHPHGGWYLDIVK
jgi:hypothetical protein